jgi:glycosyltransferase involved in cell wall biosynthesis
VARESLLFLSAHLPSPAAREAGQKTAFRNLEWLAEDYAVTLVAFCNEREMALVRSPVRQLCDEVFVVPINKATRALGVLARPTVPMIVAARWEPRVVRTIRTLRRVRTYHRVHCEWSQMALYAPLFEGIAVRTLSLHDVLYQWYERRAQASCGVRSLFWQAEAMRARRWEAKSYAAFSCIYVPTEKDRRLVAALSAVLGTRTFVLAHHVGAYSAPGSGAKSERPRVVFWGAMSRHENLEAACWLMTDVLPIIRRHVHDVQLLIAGADPPAWLVKAAEGQTDVVVTGYIEDPGSLFASARVAALPLFSGAGVKVKVLECLAAGLPVVTTPVGAEGISAGVEQGLIVCPPEPRSFAETVSLLLRDAELRTRLGQAAAHWAERNLRADKRLLLAPPAGGRAVERWPGQVDGERERT